MTNIYPAETLSGTVTSFIPLTTIFTPTAGCTEFFRLNGPSLVAFDPGYGLDIDIDVRCLPSAVTTWWEQGLFGDASDGTHTAVSIGPLICPDKWATVASSIKDSSSTLAMCCPPGYHLENGIPGSVMGDCLSNVPSGMTLTFASTSEDNSESWSTATTALASDSSVGAIAIVGWNMHRTSHTTSPTTTMTTPPISLSTTFSSIANSPNPTTSSSVSMPLQPTDTPGQSSGISSGTAAGIGIGAGLSAVGVIALIVAICVTRRRKRRALIDNLGTVAVNGYYPPANHTAVPWQVQELPPNSAKSELTGHHVGWTGIELRGLPSKQQHAAELYSG
ncbi:hypothetical protein F5X96DRAFT_512519 [Biscogniauxia mediterranea]|nr:hypothetical protein F5X96DRAFT_512519 [Biscogniauxia mediterranea]